MNLTLLRSLVGLAAAAAAATTWAATPDQLLADYEALARRDSAKFAGFSAERGAAFFRSTHGAQWSCSSCHTATPTAAGRHVVTGTTLGPLAPAANPARFTDERKVEKWFRRNCGDVVGRECTAQEKGDVLAFLRSLR